MAYWIPLGARRLRLPPSRLFTFLQFVCMVLALGVARPSFADDRLIQLDTPVDDMALLSDDNTLLLTANEDQRIIYFDLATMKVTDEVEFSPKYRLSDMAIDMSSKYAYFAGTSMAPDDAGVLMRLELANHELRTIRLGDKVLRPSIAVDDHGLLLMGDRNSSTITVVDSGQFDGSLERSILRSELPRNIYLKAGPASDIAVSADGRFAFVAHDRTSIVSLVSVEYAEVLDEIDRSREGGEAPLSIALLEDREEDNSRVNLQLLVADLSGRIVAVANLDPIFAALDVVGELSIDISSDQTFSKDVIKKLIGSTLIAANRQNRRFAISNPLGDFATLFELHGHAEYSFIERQGVVPLGRRPSSMVMSTSGVIIAVLGSDRRILSILDPSHEAAATTPSIEGSETIREIQKRLATLGYPVGGVDGFVGPSTRRAVALFQLQHNMDPNGVVDAPTLKKLRAASADEDNQVYQPMR